MLLGYYAALGLLLVPVQRRTADGPTLGRVIPAIERRALPLILACIGVFLVTGTYLLVTDHGFLGIGHFFGSAWSTLIVIKHVVVVALVGIGVYVDLLVVPDVANPVDEAARTAAIRRLARSTGAMTALGAIVLILTAAAQAS
jgi:putative copper export protein